MRLLVWLSMLLLSVAAGAADGPHIVTGSATGTYYQFGEDLVNVLAEKDQSLTVRPSSGAVNNITLLAENPNAVLGLVQSDVLGFLQRSDNAKTRQQVENLRLVAPLYQEEIHVLANVGISQFSDLDGKIVAVGEVGSGGWLTAMNMFSLMGVEPKATLRLSPEKGVVAVLREQADAVIFVGGKPVKLFSNLAKLSDYPRYARMLRKVHLVPLNDARLTAHYQQTHFLLSDYMFLKREVPTLAVTALLVSHQSPNNTQGQEAQRCAVVTAAADVLKRSFDRLQATGHPKWRDVDSAAQPVAWQRDLCAHDVMTGTELEQELLRVLQQR